MLHLSSHENWSDVIDLIFLQERGRVGGGGGALILTFSDVGDKPSLKIMAETDTVKE